MVSPRRAPLRTSASSLKSFAVQKLRLPNGMRVLLCPRPGLSQAYAAIYFGTGSRHESPEHNGLTHVLEHMVFRGTKSFADATALNTFAEDFGGYLEGATYRDHVMFATGCHKGAVDDAVQVLAELVQTPRYRAMEIERSILREELLETIDQDGRVTDPDNITHDAVFGSHPLGMPIEGNLKNLASFGKAHLEGHRKRHFVGNNAVLAIAGPIDAAALKKTITQAFAKMPAGAVPEIVTPTAALGKPVLRYVKDPGSQVELRLSFRAVPVGDPAYPALVLLARLLADGLSSRLNAELVDKRGLAYALNAGLTTYADCGLFDFEVAVAPNKAAEAVQALLAFAQGSKRFRYTQDELDRTLRRYRYSLEFLGDSAADLAGFYGRAALFNVEAETLSLYHTLTKLKAQDLHDAAKRVFTKQSLVLVAVGELTKSEWTQVQKAVADF